MLSERKIKILEALINDYIITAEPIGSRTIAKKYDFGISSATIRNEMSDLEEMGFIIQPYASAGRVPSDKGYRLYVDNLMKYRDLTEEEYMYLKEIIINNINHMDYLMEETAKAISLLTNYTTIVGESRITNFSIKNLQLMSIDNSTILLTLITDSKSIKNHFISMENIPDHDTLNKISYLLSNLLKGLSIEEMLNIDLDDIIKQNRFDKNIVNSIFESIKNVMKEENNIHIYTSGVNNILTFPEFSDIDKAKNIFKTFEEKEILITLLNSVDDGSDNIKIVIGSENSIEHMKDCSIIRADYELVGKTLGSIGILGPTRMNYTQVYSVLNGIVKTINAVLKSVNSANIDSSGNN